MATSPNRVAASVPTNAGKHPFNPDLFAIFRIEDRSQIAARVAAALATGQPLILPREKHEEPNEPNIEPIVPPQPTENTTAPVAVGPEPPSQNEPNVDPSPRLVPGMQRVPPRAINHQPADGRQLTHVTLRDPAGVARAVASFCVFLGATPFTSASSALSRLSNLSTIWDILTSSIHGGAT